MKEMVSVQELHFTDKILLICDAAGRVQSVSPGATTRMLGVQLTHKHFSEIFGRDSNLTGWLSEQISEARKQGAYHAESTLYEGEGLLFVQVESLMSADELQGFAVHLLPQGVRGTLRALSEGDAIVTRQQWHDIKNHLGGLKLYATFLKRKLPAGDDQQTVEKMLSGIDTLIDHLAKIRRGDSQ